MSHTEIIDYVIFLARDCNLNTSLIIESLAIMNLPNTVIADAINAAIVVLK